MELKAIKELADKTPVDGLVGVVEKQYPPLDQTENDLKWSQHRQSLLVHDEEGNKLMVTLMKQPLHILDFIEGHELRLTSGHNDKGELRGLVVNRWKPSGANYDSVVVKVYPEATIRAIPPGGEKTTTEPAPGKPQPAPSSGAQPSTAGSEKSGTATPTGSRQEETPSAALTPFEKHLALAAYGYCLCLDKAHEVISDRPELQKDPQNQRAIATNFWMESKHHLQTLAPGLQGHKEVARGATSQAASNPKDGPENNATLIGRVIQGHRMMEENPTTMSARAYAALVDLDRIMDERGLWESAYDNILGAFIEGCGCETPDKEARAAANQVYDDARSRLGPEANVDKFFVCGWSDWRDAVMEQIGRNEG